MNRRTLLKQMALSIPLWSLNLKTDRMKLVKAKKIRNGDRIGLIAPGSSVREEQLEKAVNNLENLGLRVEFGKNSKNRKGFLAGEDQERLEDLHHFFSKQDINGIWCLRGGYGSGRIVDQVDYKLIRKNPKIFVGYSDITVLLNSIYKKCGLIGFHGPMATSTFTDYSKARLQSVLMEASAPPSIVTDSDTKTIIHPGQATGKLIGGNLTVLTSLCGSDYLPKFKNKILFLEDIGEKPYRIDRMLTQLLLSTDLKQAAGIVLGKFENCEAGPDDISLSLKETFIDRLSNLGIPVLYGLPFGHVSDNAMLPFGITAKMDTQEGTLQFLENAVTE